MVRFTSAEGRCVSSAIWRERRCDAEVGKRKGWSLPLAAALTFVKSYSWLSSAKTHESSVFVKVWPSCLRQCAAQEKVESLPLKKPSESDPLSHLEHSETQCQKIFLASKFDFHSFLDHHLDSI